MIRIRVGRFAELLGVHRNTVTNWIKSGKLKASPTAGRKYLVEEIDLQKFCASTGVPGVTADALVHSAVADRQVVISVGAYGGLRVEGRQPVTVRSTPRDNPFYRIRESIA